MSFSPEVRSMELVKTARPDPAFRIQIVKVTGDDHVGLYVAETGRHSRVTAHYHRDGNEICQIVHGEGKLYTGICSSDNGARWNSPVVVSSGNCFTVEEGQVNQLENTGLLPMIAIIICPSAHISHDRVIVNGAIPH
jgi:mannose-6-phosphate isomerase-like protein (cupin superfamily)